MKIKSFKPKFRRSEPLVQRSSNVLVPTGRTLTPAIKGGSSSGLKITPLGGVGLVQKNMFVYEYQDDIVIIDCGVGFPDEDMPGVDLIIPDISYLKDKKSKIRGIVITHAHDDHIGGLPYIWPELNVPIYSQKLTCGFIKSKFVERKLPTNQIKTLSINDTIKLGKFDISFYQVSHSVPDSTGIVLKTPVGTLIHQADFKIDWTPVNGQTTDVATAATVSRGGVALMTIDCLGVEKSGYTLSEKAIEPTFEMLEGKTKGKLIITLMTSNITRIQQALNVASKSGRKVCLLGRSMENNFQVSRDLGYLDIPPGLIINQEQIKGFQDKDLMLIMAGSLGQPGSALDRAANNEHKFVQIKKTDTVVFSADPMPSAVVSQNSLLNKLAKIGCDVYASTITPDLHVSVLPTTEVLVKDTKGNIMLEQIQNIDENVLAYSFDKKYCTSSWLEAKKIKHSFKGQVYKITTKSGRSVEVTQGHSLFALKSCQLMEIKSENLQVGDYLVIPKSLPNLEEPFEIELSKYIPKLNNYQSINDFIFYNNQCLGPKQIKINNDWSRLLGYYLAEGSAPRHLSIVLNANEEELKNEIIILIKRLLQCSSRVVIRKNAQEITFATPFLGKVFKDWFGPGATSKRIPGFMFKATEEQRLNFLGAYINGDGGIDRGFKHSRIRIKTSSRKLASDLLYLFASVGIIARFDHIQNNPARSIGKYQLKSGISYVIRIQGEDYISKLLPYLSEKFQIYFQNYYQSSQRVSYTQTHAPEALPIREINLLDEVKPKSNTNLANIYRQLEQQKTVLSQELINRQSIVRDALSVGNPLIYYLNGDLLFDPIKKIEVSEYEGSVYDLSVPGPENFLGGFGGIFLHNSGHAAIEEIKLMINIVRPKNLMPMGGEFKHMKAFAKMAQELGYSEDQIILPEEGQIVNVSSNKTFIEQGQKTQNVYIDGLGVGDIGSEVLEERQIMSKEGVVIVMVKVERGTGKPLGQPELISRGFVFDQGSQDLMDAALEIVKNRLSRERNLSSEWKNVRGDIENQLGRFFSNELKRNPLVLPLIIEV